MWQRDFFKCKILSSPVMLISKMGLIEQNQNRSMIQVPQTSSEQVNTEGQGKSEEQLPKKL